MHRPMLGVAEMIWIKTGVDRVLWIPIYERKGSGPIESLMGSKGEGVYIDGKGYRHYYDEDGNYYMLESDYLARNDQPEPQPKPTVKPRKKAKREFNPFAQPRDLDDLPTYTDNYWGESHGVIDEGDEEQ